MPAIQSEGDWCKVVDHALNLMAGYELGEQSLYSVWVGWDFPAWVAEFAR